MKVSDEDTLKNIPVLGLGVTGSIAAVKLLEVVQELQMRFKPLIVVILTQRAKDMLAVELLIPDDTDRSTYIQEYLCDNMAEDCAVVLDDELEWNAYSNKRNEGERYVLHIHLVNVLQAFFVVPCSANSLAKICIGMADNLITSVARAWPLGRKPIGIFPAMNHRMWDHPATLEQIATLRKWSFKVINPITKLLFCGEEGIGALPEPSDIAFEIYESVTWPCPKHARNFTAETKAFKLSIGLNNK